MAASRARCGTAGEDRILRTEQHLADGRVDAGADEEVDLDRRAVRERRLDAIAVVDQAAEEMPDVQALGRQRADESAQQIGAVCLVVRKAEGIDDRVAEVRPQQRAPVVLAALVPGERPHAHPRQLVGQPQTMQDPRRVGADLDLRTGLADRRCALVDVHVEPGLQQRQRRRDAADTTADDRDRGARSLIDAEVLAALV